jgi:hypothetical protein
LRRHFRATLPNLVLHTELKGGTDPTGIGEGLKSSKSTIASFWFPGIKIAAEKSPPPFHWKMSHGGPVSRSVAHLWFLYVLLEFYAAILVLRGGVALMDRGGGIRAGVDRLVRLLMRGPLGGHPDGRTRWRCLCR